MPIELLHGALAALAHAGVLDYNWSGDVGAMSLCHLLATHVNTCEWPIVVHPPISALVSHKPLLHHGTSGADSLASIVNC